MLPGQPLGTYGYPPLSPYDLNTPSKAQNSLYATTPVIESPYSVPGATGVKENQMPESYFQELNISNDPGLAEKVRTAEKRTQDIMRKYFSPEDQQGPTISHFAPNPTANLAGLYPPAQFNAQTSSLPPLSFGQLPQNVVPDMSQGMTMHPTNVPGLNYIANPTLIPTVPPSAAYGQTTNISPQTTYPQPPSVAPSSSPDPKKKNDDFDEIEDFDDPKPASNAQNSTEKDVPISTPLPTQAPAPMHPTQTPSNALPPLPPTTAFPPLAPVTTQTDKPLDPTQTTPSPIPNSAISFGPTSTTVPSPVSTQNTTAQPSLPPLTTTSTPTPLTKPIQAPSHRSPSSAPALPGGPPISKEQLKASANQTPLPSTLPHPAPNSSIPVSPLNQPASLSNFSKNPPQSISINPSIEIDKVPELIQVDYKAPVQSANSSETKPQMQFDLSKQFIAQSSNQPFFVQKPVQEEDSSIYGPLQNVPPPALPKPTEQNIKNENQNQKNELPSIQNSSAQKTNKPISVRSANDLSKVPITSTDQKTSELLSLRSLGNLKTANPNSPPIQSQIDQKPPISTTQASPITFPQSQTAQSPSNPAPQLQAAVPCQAYPSAQPSEVKLNNLEAMPKVSPVPPLYTPPFPLQRQASGEDFSQKPMQINYPTQQAPTQPAQPYISNQPSTIPYDQSAYQASQPYSQPNHPLSSQDYKNVNANQGIGASPSIVRSEWGQETYENQSVANPFITLLQRTNKPQFNIWEEIDKSAPYIFEFYNSNKLPFLLKQNVRSIVVDLCQFLNVRDFTERDFDKIFAMIDIEGKRRISTADFSFVLEILVDIYLKAQKNPRILSMR